ncbi:hypothetical protein B6U74_00285 [Candidatus Bathyarchaeota archaeon ex4484_205]|nr:MAG: hypothetical protein B6U74_00285 [Candidatus Bathyarchaeota archaeon ex4484_205]RLG69442.1 MAG: hypothetical protein DRN93_00025 [archaeon]
MARRKRRKIKVYKRKLPSIFVCPQCGHQSISVNFENSSNSGDLKVAIVKCGFEECGLSDTFEVPKRYEKVDAYCKFVDRFNSGEIG